ncbi:MAG TPA: M13 family metallopeptidase [Steroidobacteraceae bacterium]
MLTRACSGVTAALAAVLCGYASGAGADGAPRAQIAPWGLDLSDRDTSVKPGDDFYRYADGHWADSHHIPPDRSRWGSFEELEELSEQRVHAIIEGLPAEAPAGSVAQKIGDYYRAYLDSDAIERAGLAPARPALEAIAAARIPEDVARLMGRPDLALQAPLRVGMTTDQKNPDRYIVTLTQSGLGMPDRDYYLKDDAVYAGFRDQYRTHIERMLKLAGDASAGQAAQAVLELETHIAKLHWPVARRRDRDLTYNLRSREELDALAPGFPWGAWLAADGLDGQQDFVVRELDAVQALAQLLTSVPVEQWRAYLRYHYLAASAEVLPKALDDEAFDFYGRALHGQQQQRDRWKRAVAALDRDLGEAVGERYVQRYFPPASRQKMLELVENLRATYAGRIARLTWMTPATRKLALEKLAAFHPKIGYPDQWRDYSALTVVKGDAFGNATRAAVFDWQRRVRRMGERTDRGEWGMTPQTINAYYNATFNEVVFPAAILQPPFFDPDADDAVNYGGIGGVIGHEMGHGFDDQGSKSDAHGVLHSWWQPEDTQAFKSRVDHLAAQYDGYTVLPGLNINGRLTLGENIGDLGGLSVAYEAYHRSLHGKPAPVRDGLSGDQRYFLAWAQVWRGLYREEQLRSQVMSNPHSPNQFRVNGVVRNVDAWYDAFSVRPGDQLYLPPQERVHIW